MHSLIFFMTPALLGVGMGPKRQRGPRRLPGELRWLFLHKWLCLVSDLGHRPGGLPGVCGHRIVGPAQDERRILGIRSLGYLFPEFQFLPSPSAGTTPYSNYSQWTEWVKQLADDIAIIPVASYAELNSAL